MDKAADLCKDGPYHGRMKKFALAGKNSEGMLGDPIVIGKVIQEAAEAKNPKHRYLKGPFAKEFVFIKGWFGTGVFDWLMNLQF